MKISRLIVIGLVLSGAVGAGLAYQRLHKVQVRGARVVRGDVMDAVYASGPVEAVERVEVKARISGPIGLLHVRVGQRVRKGELLARVNAPTLGLEVARGKVDMLAARERADVAPQVQALEHQAGALRAQLLQAKADEARTRNLVESGAGTAQELERARVPLSTLEAQLAANRAQQQDLRIALRADAGRQRAGVAALRARATDADVLSPMDGIVLHRHVELGEVVAVSQNVLRIGDLGHLWIEARVDEADIGRVREGGPAAVRLYAFPGRTYRGKVARILPDADRERKSFEVDLDLAEPIAGLRPGMTAEVNIIVQERRGVLLAPADVVRDRHVWVVHDGRLQRRDVEVGVRDQARVELVRGVSEGEVLVVDEESGLREGALVHVKE